MKATFNKLQDLAVRKQPPARTLLLSEGDPVRGFYWLAEGSVRIYQLSMDAKELEVARFGSHQWVAPALTLSADRFPHYMETLEKCEIYFIPKQAAWERIVHDPELAGFFTRLLAERCQMLHNRLHALQFQTLRERFLQFLLQKCPHDGTCGIRLPIPKKELAAMLGATPEALSRTMKQLVEEGALHMKGRTFQVTHCNRLCTPK